MAVVDQVNTIQSQQKSAGTEQKGSQGNLAVGNSQNSAAKAANMQNSSSVQMTADGIQYDVSKRTTQVAVWWKDMAQLEEEFASEEAVLEEEEELPWEKDKDAYDESEKGIRSLERMLERMREKQKTNNNNSKTKRALNYNHRKVSSAIGGAKTLMQASSALASANTNLNSIRRKAASGKYDQDEIAIAKNHAMKMVRTARKKVRNIKLEANKNKQNTMTETRKRQDTNAVINRPQHQKMKEELQRLKKELERQEKKYKNVHRRKEGWDLMQADMEYLRRKIDLMRRQDEESIVSDVSQQESVAVVPEMTSTITAENKETIETQQQAAIAVAQVSVNTATVSIDVTV